MRFDNRLRRITYIFYRQETNIIFAPAKCHLKDTSVYFYMRHVQSFHVFAMKELNVLVVVFLIIFLTSVTGRGISIRKGKYVTYTYKTQGNGHF